MPLTQPQREHLTKRLLEERRRVLQDLGRQDEQLGTTEQNADGDLTKVPFHMADQGTDTIDRELGALDASRLSRELEEIDAALDRLYRDPDNFGRDERTGAEIPFERLDVIPWARTSVNRPSPSDASASRGSEAPELPGP